MRKRNAIHPGKSAIDPPVIQPRVRLPHSAVSRQALTFVLLIHRVYPRRVMLDAFEGPQFRSGETIDQAKLWPEADYPAEPLLLEYAGSDRSGRGHRRSRHTYLLWRFDQVLGKWIELARSAAVSTEWVECLKPIALRCIKAAGREHPKTAAEAVSRTLCYVHSEKEKLEGSALAEYIGLLYEQFTAMYVSDRDRRWPEGSGGLV